MSKRELKRRRGDRHIVARTNRFDPADAIHDLGRGDLVIVARALDSAFEQEERQLTEQRPKLGTEEVAARVTFATVLISFSIHR